MTTTLQTIQHTIQLEAPLENIWKAIATQEGLSGWFMPNNFQPVIGGNFTFQSEPTDRWDGVVPCKLLDLQKHRRIVIRWLVHHKYETILTFKLSTSENHTDLTITHSGWENMPFEFMGLRYILDQGWGKHAPEQLRDYLKSIQPKN